MPTALAPTHTLLLAGRPSSRLDDLARRLDATVITLDLADTESLGPVDVDELDVLVHNAGVAHPDHLAESRIDDWRKAFEVNVIGAVALTQALLPALRRAKGQVIFVNSGAGLHVLAGMASKHYLRPETVADAIANIVATPPDGHVHEIILRQRS